MGSAFVVRGDFVPGTVKVRFIVNKSKHRSIVIILEKIFCVASNCTSYLWISSSDVLRYELDKMTRQIGGKLQMCKTHFTCRNLQMCKYDFRYLFCGKVTSFLHEIKIHIYIFCDFMTLLNTKKYMFVDCLNLP